MTTVGPVRLLAAVLLTGVLASGCSEASTRDGDGSGAASASPPASSGPAAPDSSPEPSATPRARPTEAAPDVAYEDLTPSPEDAYDDSADLYRDGCQVTMDDDTLSGCTYGASAEDATATVAVVGDSKAAQWMPALQELAAARGWRIRLYTKSTCAPVAVPLSRDDAEYVACTTYNRLVDDELVRDPVDLVLAGSSDDNALVTRRLAPDEDPDAVAQATFVRGELKAWSRWIAAGNRVAVISDTPRPLANGKSFDVPTCLQDHQDDVGACSYDRLAGMRASGRGVQVRAIRAARAVDLSPALGGSDVPAAARADLLWIDPVPLVCPGETCLPHDGDVLVYRDGSHLSRTFVESLTERIGLAFSAAGLP